MAVLKIHRNHRYPGSKNVAPFHGYVSELILHFFLESLNLFSYNLKKKTGIIGLYIFAVKVLKK